jgi:hypothetical protein
MGAQQRTLCESNLRLGEWGILEQFGSAPLERRGRRRRFNRFFAEGHQKNVEHHFFLFL